MQLKDKKMGWEAAQQWNIYLLYSVPGSIPSIGRQRQRQRYTETELGGRDRHRDRVRGRESYRAILEIVELCFLSIYQNTYY